MAETATQYFTRMCREAGKSDADIAALTAILSDPTLAPKFDETIRRSTDDFTAMQGRVAAADKKVKQYDEEWYPKANSEYQRAMQELADAKAALIVANGNGGGGNNPPPADTSQFLTKSDLAAHRADLDARYARVIKEGLRLASRHAARYHEELDVAALEKTATDGNMSLTAAYDQMVKPRVDADQKAQFEKEKTEAVAQAVKDALSRHKLPVDAVPAETAPVYRIRDAKDTATDIDSELLSAWNGATAARK
mgnify:CR=1 FL=1